MGNPHAFWIGGRARGEDYFNIVIFLDMVHSVPVGGMSGKQGMKPAKIQHGDVHVSERTSDIVTNQKLCGDLCLYSTDQRLVALHIQRHHDYAAEQTAKETRNPFGTVRGPQQYSIGFPDAAYLEFARELVSGAGKPGIGPGSGP